MIKLLKHTHKKSVLKAIRKGGEGKICYLQRVAKRLSKANIRNYEN